MEPPFIKFSLILDVIYNLYFLLTCYSATGPINRTQYSHLWLEHKPPRYISNTHIYIFIMHYLYLEIIFRAFTLFQNTLSYIFLLTSRNNPTG